MFPGLLTQLSWAGLSNVPEKFVIHDQQSASFEIPVKELSSSYLALLSIIVCLPGIVKVDSWASIKDDGA